MTKATVSRAPFGKRKPNAPRARVVKASAGIAAAALLAATIAGCGSTTTASTSSAVAVNVTSPSSGTVVSADNVTIRGTVTPTNASVQIQGQSAPVGNGVFVGNASIHSGTNTINIIASAPGYAPASTTITLTGQSTSNTGTSRPSTSSGGAATNQGGSGANASPADLESASPPSGAYSILVPSNWSYHEEPPLSEASTDVWVGSNPLEKLRITLSSCVACASSDGRPDARAVGLPPGTVSTFEINKAALGYQVTTSGNPNPDNGVVVVTSQEDTPTGYAEVDLWLPDSLHGTATRILDSFSLLKDVTG